MVVDGVAARIVEEEEAEVPAFVPEAVEEEEVAEEAQDVMALAQPEWEFPFAFG